LSNIDELPDLAGDVRDRAIPPPYEQVTRRVRARRVRTVFGTLAATALTVGGLAVWQNAATTASPNPAPPITQPADPAYPASAGWRQVVDGTGSHPFQAVGTDDGSIAVVWRALEQPEPTFALVIREADGTVHGRRLDAPVSLTPVPGGWVGLRTARAWFIAVDGTWTDLGEPGAPRDPQPGDVLVANQYARWLFAPYARTWSFLPVGYGESGAAYITPAGFRINCVGPDDGQMGIYRDGQRVAEAPGDACTISGHHDSVVVVVTVDHPSGSIPIGNVLWSDDAGAEWGPIDFASGSLNSVSVLYDGTPVIGTEGGAVTVGQFQSLEGEHGFAFAAGRRLYTLAYGLSTGPMSYTDDKGDTWHTAPLPGMESSED
jgi:hypothetical protein